MVKVEVKSQDGGRATKSHELFKALKNSKNSWMVFDQIKKNVGTFLHIRRHLLNPNQSPFEQENCNGFNIVPALTFSFRKVCVAGFDPVIRYCIIYAVRRVKENMT